jgi:hypothetical protein
VIAGSRGVGRSAYGQCLLGAFALLNALRIVSYLPTFWAIQASGDSSQHSLWTWSVWAASNLVTGLWHLECRGRAWDITALVLMVNAALCGGVMVLVAVHRV